MPTAMSGLRSQAGIQPDGSGQGRASRSVRVLDVAGGAVRLGEVEAYRALADGPDGESCGKQHCVVGLAAQPAERRCDVDVGGDQHSGGVELAEQTLRPSRQPHVVKIVVLILEQHRHGAPRSSRADTSSTSAAGGCQENTPHGTPPTTGVSGPHMPRRNR